MHFIEPVSFGFSGFSTIELSMPEAGRSALGLERCSLLLWTFCSVNIVSTVFLSEAHPGVADGTSQGPGQSTHR
jgi:hypothetical protein